MRLLHLIVLSFFAVSVNGADVRPWRPPFGLDRVGHSPDPVELEADAEVRPAQIVNPVDLGAILVPEGWLLVRPGQEALLTIATFLHGLDLTGAQVRVWYDSATDQPLELRTNLVRDIRQVFTLPLHAPETRAPKDKLHIGIYHQGVQHWSKTIPVMVVEQPPDLPRFGVAQLKLRYDLPITINSGEGGKLGALSYLSYEDGWAPEWKDVVVCLPNGSRWVFWRGSSYIPFWVTAHNTGVCYEWAETTPPPDGIDCVEPLMDKELRYSRVQVMEATAARVHVKWDYQSTDLHYKVWGDRAVEDFYFYPDGFGTRVLTLRRRPQAPYELSEFIILSPPKAYPLRFIPTNAVEMLYFDGTKKSLSFPPGSDGPYQPDRYRQESPVVYCVRGHRDDRARAVYFHPSSTHYPAVQFGPFHAGGHLVTPAYWGSHWPLSRGKSTGSEIDERVESSPAHNSLVTWGMNNSPPPLSRAQEKTVDALGNSREMLIERWAWLIAMTDAPDIDLVNCARSFSSPPSIQAEGAELEFDPCAPERRALRLKVREQTVRLTLTPTIVTINPAFELSGAPKELASLELNGRAVAPSDYAWDGSVLWIKATITEPTALKLFFQF